MEVVKFAKPKDMKKPRRRVGKHMKKKANSERTKAEKALFDLMRPHIFARDGNACVACGGTKQLQMAHVFSQGKFKRLKFEPENIMTMDYKCHLGYGGWHKDPPKWWRWFDEKYPGKYERLQVMASYAPKVDLKALIAVWSSDAWVRSLWLERVKNELKVDRE